MSVGSVSIGQLSQLIPPANTGSDQSPVTINRTRCNDITARGGVCLIQLLQGWNHTFFAPVQ